MYSSLLLLFSLLLYWLCFAVDEANIFLVVAKVVPALFIRIIWSHVIHTHTSERRVCVISFGFGLSICSHNTERERERKSQQFNVKETNRTYTLSSFLPLTIRAADSLKVLLASSCVGVHFCVGCLINRPQAFPICLYCIIA